MIALVGGDSIRCADYATFGTQQLSDHALAALIDRKTCLLANHGMIATGKDIEDAFRVTLEVETLSEMYLRALQAGEPVLLSGQEFRDAQQRFAACGQSGAGQAAEKKPR